MEERAHWGSEIFLYSGLWPRVEYFATSQMFLGGFLFLRESSSYSWRSGTVLNLPGVIFCKGWNRRFWPVKITIGGPVAYYPI